jgi:hypothetical protein
MARWKGSPVPIVLAMQRSHRRTRCTSGSFDAAANINRVMCKAAHTSSPIGKLLMGPLPTGSGGRGNAQKSFPSGRLSRVELDPPHPKGGLK